MNNNIAKHGGDIYTDGLLKDKKLLDFSSNINPLGIPLSFTKNISVALEALTRYPDIRYRKLKAYLLDYLKEETLNEDNIILGNGAAEIIDIALGSFKNILIVVPSFIEYEEVASKWGANIIYSYLNANMEFDYKDILGKLSNCEALVIANPNNPNGSIIDKSKFYTILDFCERNNKKIIIDEAFVEFVLQHNASFIKELKDYNCLFIIRALTKFFALPGIRLGYGVSRDKEFITQMCNKQIPWNINCFAEVAATYVLKDEDYKNKSIQWIKNTRDAFIKELNSISFIDKAYESYGNYVLCKLSKINDKKLYDLCLERNILIRRCSNYRGLNDNYVRFAIKDKESNEFLINSLRQIEHSLR